MAKDTLTPALVWAPVHADVIPSKYGCIMFDNSVLDKTSSKAIEIARWQYSGHEVK